MEIIGKKRKNIFSTACSSDLLVTNVLGPNIQCYGLLTTDVHRIKVTPATPSAFFLALFIAAALYRVWEVKIAPVDPKETQVTPLMTASDSPSKYQSTTAPEKSAVRSLHSILFCIPYVEVIRTPLVRNCCFRSKVDSVPS